ncbi:MAPK kinase substrate protein [Zea mays]|uniref:MAPK kinase substrate protein n=1 Tax=Zea mays TaxID=4577 RepID=A0A3L6ESN1_MAIZE|nr:MAPK kinase substrate protein [Zea mays]
MDGLQRSAQTFRRSGSSGLVWDERFITEGAGAAAPRQQPELRHSRSVGGSVAMLLLGGEADRDDKRKLTLAKPNLKGHHKKQEELVPGRKAFRTKDVAPAAEPPSPRVLAICCAPCSIFRDAGAGGSSSLARRAKKR